MGIILNRPASCATSGAARTIARDRLRRAHQNCRARPGYSGAVLAGGADRPRFVLHSADFHINNSTLPIDEGVSLTATIDILRAIAMAKPRRALLALGYAGWARANSKTKSAQRLAALPGRSGHRLRPRPRHQIFARAALHRHRSGEPVVTAGMREPLTASDCCAADEGVDPHLYLRLSSPR